MAKEILDLNDIKLLVDAFYSKVRKDALLSPVFNERIKGNWAEHLEKIYSFWQTVLLEELTYSGSPFKPHAMLPVELEHFNRWIFLFNETIDEHFTGEKAREAKWKAGKMAEMFHHKIEHYRQNPGNTIL